MCETGDGNPIPAESVRRKCCDAVIVPIVLNGAGVVVDEGRARRVATREQRRALRAMYATCAHPRCGVRFEDCQIHHVIPWEHHGPTDLSNLLPLCTAHHHLVHEGGWQLALSPDRTIELRRPDGTIHFHGSIVDRAPAGVAPQPPPASPGASSDPYPEIPAHLKAPAARSRAEPAAVATGSAPPARRPWKPEPTLTEIPDHLIRAAQDFQAAKRQGSDPPSRTQQAQIAAALIRRIDPLGTAGVTSSTTGVPNPDDSGCAELDLPQDGSTDRRHGPPARAPAA